MTLHVTVRCEVGDEIIESFHVDNPRNSPTAFVDNLSSYWFVDIVQATGPELAHIRRQFTGLPDVPGSPLVRWRGDYARFIIDNW